MKITRKDKARRSTIAPRGLNEKDNYYIIGETFVRVVTFITFPEIFGEGLLSQFVNNPNYHIDMYTEPAKIDVSSALKKEMKFTQEKYEKSTDPTEKQRLELKYRSYEEFIKQTVVNKSGTLNTIVNLYIRATNLEDLDKQTKEVTDILGGMGIDIRARTISQSQIDIMKKNSPLFIESDLSKNMDFLIGQPLPSLSVAGTWPWIFDTLDDRNGTLIGRELTNGGKVIFNQFAYLDEPEKAKLLGRTAGNMIVVGRTGMGKTTLMNILCFGHLINHKKIIWADPENKNERLTRFVGGNYIEFGKDDQIINIFDLKPISTDSEEREEESVMYNTNNAIANVVEDIAITFKQLWPDITDNEIDMINEITVRTYRSVGIDGTESFKNFKLEDYPTFSNFSSVIDEMLESMTEKIALYKLEYDAVKLLQMKMRRLVGTPDIPGQWSRYFNGTTSIKTDALDKSGLVSFGTKLLFNVTEGLRNALLRLVFNYSWSICLGTEEESVFVTDEDHNYILVPEIAEIKAQFQRRSRKYRTVTLSGTQQVKDYSAPEIKTHGQAIFDNATYKFYFNLTKDGINDLSNLVTLTDGEKNQLEHLAPYTGILEIGNKKMPVEVLATPDELSLMP